MNDYVKRNNQVVTNYQKASEIIDLHNKGIKAGIIVGLIPVASTILPASMISGAGINFTGQLAVHSVMEYSFADDPSIENIIINRIDYADVGLGALSGSSSTIGQLTFQVVLPSAVDFQGGEFKSIGFGKSSEEAVIDGVTNLFFFGFSKYLQGLKTKPTTKEEVIDNLMIYLDPKNKLVERYTSGLRISDFVIGEFPQQTLEVLRKIKNVNLNAHELISTVNEQSISTGIKESRK